ncbi:MAG: acyltransferase [Candidatus Contendobacter sp.]
MFRSSFSLGYSPPLDGLRGIAILSVMLFHTDAPFLKGGFLGVDLFFVLSGFLITSLLVAEFDTYGTISLKDFYIRRILRLIPALMLLLLVFCLLSFLLLTSEKANRNYVDALISLAYVSNWARAFSMHPPDYLGHTWSLSIEEQFYILWPIVLLCLLRVSTRRFYIVLFAIATAIISWILRVSFLESGATLERLYNGLDTRADALMAGCAVGTALMSGLLTSKKPRKNLVLFNLTALVSFGVLCAFLIFGDWRATFLYQFGFIIIELLAVILIIDVLTNPKSIIRKFLEIKELVWVGSISYGLYLWHYPIFRIMFELNYGWSIVLIIGFPVTFAVAVASYFLMEKPILKLKKGFSHLSPIGSPEPTPTPSVLIRPASERG